MQQGSYPIGTRTINVLTDNATGVVTGATCDIPLNALASAIQTFLNLGTPIAVAYGGTGANNAVTARLNLGSAASGANNDITSLNGLTTPLSVSQGGTGATSAGATAANNIGALAIANNLSDLNSVSTARTNLGLGTMATQNANGVAVTGGSINGTTVGATTPSTGAFTTVSASSTVSGAGFSTYLASPPAIGGTAPNSGAFTTITASSTITPSQTSGIVGTTTNNNANAGSVGEYVSATAGPTALTSGTNANLATISLTAGDWDVEGYVLFATQTGDTMTLANAAVTTTSVTFPAIPLYATWPVSTGPSANVSLHAPEQRLSLSATTSVFLVVGASHSGGTLNATGMIRARRVR